MTLKFTIPGNPFGKERPRFGAGNTHTPQKTKDYEELVAWSYRQQCGTKHFPHGTALELVVMAYMPIPKSAPRKDRARMITGDIRPTVTPDWDNIGKIISDALNKVAYDDDKAIVDGYVRKWYSEDPHVEVIIKEAIPY